MTSIKKFILGFAVAAMIAPAANAATINDDPEIGSVEEIQAVKEFPITITNRTGFDIIGLFISDSGSEEWSDNFLDEVLENGESIRIMCQDPGKYDISITYYNDVECELYEVNFQRAIHITFSLSSDGTQTIFNYNY